MNSSHHKHVNNDRKIVLRTMKALESSVYKRPRAQSMPELFRGLWRRQIVEWMYVLIKYCKLRHEATAAAVYYLDAAVMCDSSSLVNSPRDYQLCAMTALYLALKVYDSPAVRVIKLKHLVKLGNGEFTVDDIIQKEQELVQALSWRINPPTANCFLHRYMELLPFLDDSDEEYNVDTIDVQTEEEKQLRPVELRRLKRLEKIQEVAYEYIEVAMSRDRFLSVPASVIAYAALLSAMELVTAEQEKKKLACYYDWSAFLSNMKEIAEMGDILGDFDPEGERKARGVRRTKTYLDKIVKGLDHSDGERGDDFCIAGLETNSSKARDGSDTRDDHSSQSTKASTIRSYTPPSPTSTASSLNTGPLAPRL